MKSTMQRIGNLSIPLIFGVIFALLWANIDFEGYHNIIYYKLFGEVDAHFLFNDVFMVFFFGLAGVEIVQSMSPGGNLYPMKKAIPTLFATAGGVVGPILVFFILNHFFGSPDYANGWAIPTATDVAIALLFVKIVFGARHPAISFLLLLAVLDDAVGMFIIAVFYPDPSHPVQFIWLGLVLVAMGLAWIFNHKLKIRTYWMYILIPGVLAWVSMYMAGLHASLALVFIIPFFPLNVIRPEKRSTIKNFEHDFQSFVDYGLFFFGITNAGVLFADVSSLTFIILLSLLLGKTIGISGMAELSNKFGFGLPEKIGHKELLLIGMVASIGLTVSLFIAGSAYGSIEVQGAAKMGALMSVGSGFIAILTSKLLLKKTNKRRVKVFRKRLKTKKLLLTKG